MAQTRFVPRALVDRPVAPFNSAEEAWFWFVRCQQVRQEGARLGDSGLFMRPCDPDDVYRAVKALMHQGLLRTQHLKALATFGMNGRPPDARRPDEVTAGRLWIEALDHLSTILRMKGIVE